jgi:hypothetical protein
MKFTEHIAQHGGRMPSRKRRHRLHIALGLFEKAYTEWLRNQWEVEPRAATWGLKKSQVSTIIRHCRSLAARDDQRRTPRHD